MRLLPPSPGAPPRQPLKFNRDPQAPCWAGRQKDPGALGSSCQGEETVLSWPGLRSRGVSAERGGEAGALRIFQVPDLVRGTLPAPEGSEDPSPDGGPAAHPSRSRRTLTNFPWILSPKSASSMKEHPPGSVWGQCQLCGQSTGPGAEAWG